MNKQLLIKTVLSLLIIQAFLVSCIPMNSEQVFSKAVTLYGEMVKAGPERSSSKEGKSKKIDINDLAENQTIHLSGRNIYSYDPAFIYSEDMFIAEQLFVGLARMDPDTKEYLPVLAEKWSISEDQLTWTFDLQKNIPWVAYNPQTQKVDALKDASGQVQFVTAEDVRTGILRVLSPTMYSGNAFNLKWIVGAEEYTSGLGDINAVGIEVLNENQIAIHLISPHASLDALTELSLFSAFPTWLPSDYNQVMTPEMMIAFSGPYAIKDYIAGQSITLIKNPLWKGTEGLPVPTLEEIVYDLTPYADQDVVASFKAGGLDAVELNYDEYLAVKDDPEFKDLLRIEPGSCGYYLLFNNMNLAPLNEAKIRQAISAAIDRQKLNDIVYKGTGSQLLQYVPPFLRGSQDLSGKNRFGYDPKEAKSLLESSDWIKGVDLQSQTLTMQVIESGNYSGIAESISEDLQNSLGLTVNVEKFGWADYSTTIQNSQSPSLYLYGYCLDYADAKNLWDLWLTGSPFSDVARGTYSNSELYTMVNKSSSIKDLAERQKLYAQAEEILINQDTVIVPLVWNSRVWLVKPNVNAEILPFYQQLENWQIIK
jgi:oligopeptide transport system substrate-binding protein